MFFIFLLSLAAFSIAGSAAYFSVYGLANTFHGTFWSVVIMGGSLEFGKLIAASYLYRYWKKTKFVLKSYLMLGVLGLMALTSLGIFGYLSTGYQTDALPLKQLEQQVALMDEEKVRLLNRKKQIDDQIANLPADYSRSRIKLMNSFKTEQEQVTTRLTQLDKEVLEVKTKVIHTEAHIGPITYIAKALGESPDDATKYLIYLIIFVFDPMAVALTLAVNVALKNRKEENDIILDNPVNYVAARKDSILDTSPVLYTEEKNIQEVKPEKVDLTLENIESIEEEQVESIAAPYDSGYVPVSTVSLNTTIEPTQAIEEEEVIIEPEVITTQEPIVQPMVQPPPRRIRPYGGIDAHTSVQDLLSRHAYFKSKEDQGDTLALDERWEFAAIKEALHKQGYNIYI